MIHIPFDFTPEDEALIDEVATRARPLESHFGSAIRKQSLIARDYWVGFAGELALSRYLTGGDEAFLRSREQLEKGGTDCGEDVPGFRVDIKSSWASFNRPKKYHRLAVRPAQLLDDWIYILGLYDDCRLTMMGWATTRDLRSSFDKLCYGGFLGAHVIRADKLNPMPGSTEARQLWSIPSKRA